MSDDPHQDIARLVDEAQPIGEGDDYDPAEDWDGGSGAPPDGGDGSDGPGKPHPDDLAWCARLDHSDTDNGKRLMRYFGAGLAVLAQDEVAGGAWMCWTGTHWDLAGGLAGASRVVQRLGDFIILEAAYLASTPREKREIEAAAPFEGLARNQLDDEARALVQAAERAAEALEKRQAKRRGFGVSSKNKARMEAALHCAAPHLRRMPDTFNPDRFKVACLTHTLTFIRTRDDECPDPDSVRWTTRCEATPGHRREDWITALVPQPWQEDAPAPRWRNFLTWMLPDAEKRRTVHQFTGLGLLSLFSQHLMFHYGLGANGKSVFLESVARVLGPSLVVDLPRESIVGGSERASGGAAPDIARLYGRRMVRVTEVTGNVPLQEDMIKRLTGGEKVTVRALFKGFFEFQNNASPHMSGNEYPTIAGTDNGIWRRMLLVHWDQTIPLAQQGDFEAVVSGFVRDEGPGILAWLAEGVCDYLAHGGLFIADAVRADTQHYREDMDPVGEFLAACAERREGERVSAHAFYKAYEDYSLANAKRPISSTRFGKRLKQLFGHGPIEGRRFYFDVALHDVPDRPDAPQPQDSLDLKPRDPHQR